MAFIPKLIGQPYNEKLELEYRHYVLSQGMGIYSAYGNYLNAKFGSDFVNLYLYFDRNSPHQEMILGRLHLAFNTPFFYHANILSYQLSEHPLDTRVLVSFDSSKGSAIFIVDVITKHIFKKRLAGEILTMQMSLQAEKIRIYPTLEYYQKQEENPYPLGTMFSMPYQDLYRPGVYQVAKTDALIARARSASATATLVGEIGYVEKIWHHQGGKRQYLTTHAIVQTDFGEISVIFHEADNAVRDIFQGQILIAEGILVGDVAVGYFQQGTYSDA